jgi:hypothetical protein
VFKNTGSRGATELDSPHEAVVQLSAQTLGNRLPRDKTFLSVFEQLKLRINPTGKLFSRRWSELDRQVVPILRFRPWHGGCLIIA